MEVRSGQFNPFMKFNGIIIASLIFTMVLFSAVFVYDAEINVDAKLNDSNYSLHQTNTTEFRNITSIELSIDNSVIEYGDLANVTYGILNNESLYVANQTYQLYLVRGFVSIVTTTVLQRQNTTLLLNQTSTGVEENYILNTLPVGIDPLVPEEYKLFITTNDNGTLFNNTVSFEVIPHEGAEIFVTVVELPDLEIVDGPIDLSENEVKELQVILTNVGDGNAVDVDLDLTISDGPLIRNGSSGFQDIVISPADQIKFNFSIQWQNYGISEVRINLLYNNTLDLRLQIPLTLSVHTFPQIIGLIRQTGDIFLGKFTTFTAEIYNPDRVELWGSVKLSSSAFSFSPIESEIDLMNDSVNYFDFTGLAIKNGTQDVTLIFTYFDPDGENTFSFALRTITKSINDPIAGDQQPTRFNIRPLVTALVLLYIIMFLIPVILYFRQDLRSTVINLITGGVTRSDIDYENTKVIVDGSNVAWEELSPTGKPKIENIIKAIEKLSEYGFNEIVVVVDAALRYQIEDPQLLDKESKKGTIKVLPAKVDGDSFILRLSRDLNALILTNDLYKEYRSEFEWIDDRRIPYSILSGVMYLHPLFDKNNESEDLN